MYLDCGEVYLNKTGKDMRSIAMGLGSPPMKIGMAVGGATAYLKGAMAGSMMRRSAKRSARKAMKNMESIVGDIKYMFR